MSFFAFFKKEFGDKETVFLVINRIYIFFDRRTEGHIFLNQLITRIFQKDILLTCRDVRFVRP